MIKKKIKEFLFKNGLYYRVRYSSAFRLYQRIFKPADIRREQKEIVFYQSFLPPCKLIFDIGANDGHKTEAFLHIAGKIVCCEPDKLNFVLLKARFRKKRGKVIIENFGLADEEGTATFLEHHPGSAFNTFSNDWRAILEEKGLEKWNEEIVYTITHSMKTTTLDKLIQKHGLPDYIKIDVEGFEEFVLKGLSQPVPYLSFESLLPECSDMLKRCFDLIENLSTPVEYNVAKEEKLLLPRYTDREAINHWINSNMNIGGFEVIVKMPV